MYYLRFICVHLWLEIFLCALGVLAVKPGARFAPRYFSFAFLPAIS
jgi:hypothetical protein